MIPEMLSTAVPTPAPTVQPTAVPTVEPTVQPSPTAAPTIEPTADGSAFTVDLEPYYASGTSNPNVFGPIEVFDTCISSSSNQFVLTFDDGPFVSLNQTLRIMELLDYLELPATFFVAPAANEPELLAQKCALIPQMLEKFHIGCHSWTHPDFLNLTQQQVSDQMNACANWVKSCGNGYEVQLFRPPYGDLTSREAAFISSTLGYQIVFWNYDTLDWTDPNDFDLEWSNFTSWIDTYRNKYGNYPRSILMLMHDFAEWDYSSISNHFLYRLKNAYSSQYNFVTAEHCLDECPSANINAGQACTDSTMPTYYTIRAWNL